LNGFEIQTDGLIDPVHLLQDESLTFPARNAASDMRWSALVGMIVQGLTSNDPDTRTRAALRILVIYRKKRMREGETNEAARAIWTDPLPPFRKHFAIQDLLEWASFLLPEERAGQAELEFRSKWLTGTPNADALFHELGAVLLSRKDDLPLLTLTEDDRNTIQQAVKRWIAEPNPERNPHNPYAPHMRRQGLEGLRTVLLVLHPDSELARSLIEKIHSLNSIGLHAFGLIPAVTRLDPSNLDELTRLLRTGLASDDGDTTDSAFLTLHRWLELSTTPEQGVPSPSIELVRELGVAIATRRRGVLARALQAARLVFEKGDADQKGSIIALVIHGLGFMLDELQYNRHHSATEISDIPIFRWACAHLALALQPSGYTDPIVQKWIDVIKNDPLPEVRYSNRPNG
jgi:hypothetical protein